jgi:hypothetical protein
MKMTTIINNLGEKITKWTSHKHPDNPNFMQVVRYMHVEFPDGRNNLYWRLDNSAPYDKHIIGNISLSKAKELYEDTIEPELTEAYFQKWLSERNKI